MDKLLVVNFSHPLTSDQMSQLAALASTPLDRVEQRLASTHVDLGAPLSAQIEALIDGAAGLSADEWQTCSVVVALPGHSAVAGCLLAALHGLLGHFPTIARLAPVAGSTPQRYEVVELVNLQQLRDRQRQRRAALDR